MGVRNRRPDLNGVIVIDKPLGWTSARAVNAARRATSGARVGHAGTLDPLATGVLILCIGKATRLVEKFMAEPKRYAAVIDLSRTSESHDLERETTAVHVDSAPTEAQVRAALLNFVGSIEQLPPAHSAVKVGGKRAYDLARRGRLNETDRVADVPGAAEGEPAAMLKPRTVRIDAIEVRRYAWPILEVDIACGKGTYIRSLARDIGRALSTGGVLTGLVRTASGGFVIEDALAGSALEKPLGGKAIIPMNDPRLLGPGADGGKEQPPGAPA